MSENLDYGRLFRGAAWALARVCCVGLLFLGATSCLPAAQENSGGSGGGENSSSGGSTGSSSSTNSTGGRENSGGTTSGGGGTTSQNSTAESGGTTSASSTNRNGGTTNAGGTTSASSSNRNGGTTTTTTNTIASTGGTISTGGDTGGGNTSVSPTGTTVTFAAGKASGAMTGYGWVALGSADAVTDPTCGPGKTTITQAAPCATSTNWSSPTALCVTGSIPALGTPPDYAGNWGISVGVNADAAFGGLSQSFSSITIAVTGSPSSGLRAMVHKRGDPDATSYCATYAAGAMPLTSFSTTCYTPAAPGIAITAADVPNIDKISVQVSSGAAAIAVANLCITGITFAK